VAELTGLHEQTIRQYERLGLIKPQRSPGGTRMFSEGELEKLVAINALTRDMGINLAGVEVILRMRERHAGLLALAREMFACLDDTARARFGSLLRGDEPGLVPAPRQALATLREAAEEEIK
jgi:MerR family transcriptional regulator/heat shock protein HspR